ncbi:MAG: Prokaryotic Cytochrome oxidase subunit [Actinomycetia bacterium]|nr:Prokaryotic Cytochrome oxidase subunit [Actinomycetes bacterium]
MSDENSAENGSDTTDVEAAGANGGAVMTRDAESADVATRPDQVLMLPGEVKPHPTPRQYVLIAVVLVVITGFEIGASYLDGDINSTLLIGLLAVMAAIKFVLVVSWYMHLRTDLKVFRRAFVVGLFLAGFVYMVALTSLHLFNSGKGAR